MTICKVVVFVELILFNKVSMRGSADSLRFGPGGIGEGQTRFVGVPEKSRTPGLKLGKSAGEQVGEAGLHVEEVSTAVDAVLSAVPGAEGKEVE